MSSDVGTVLPAILPVQFPPPGESEETHWRSQFWRNRTGNPVLLTLRTRGRYAEIKQTH